MKKYEGSWSVNNGSTYSSGYISNNKRELAKEMKAIAEGNVFSGNSGNWYVSDFLTGNIILSGSVK